MKPAAPILVACLFFLSACGDSRLERVGSGAVIGAAVGGPTGAVCCRDPIDGFGNGVMIGAAVGAIIGLILDEPLFFNHHSK